ncbi:hypothetical protein AB1Y20_001910 [Prymnesium parvum]|uniref:3-hydroxyisobutyrate dehydrogenase n=1 Tax=Prymnesium parvum TaxID=97485 RepID=A0AB34J7C1_PRYPA|mmetsp:Transcript_37088/g.85096  ORF Transcript_37088/g.85096 Transcript_37088/m.85096 type:complete len:294 (+) Transcript_37088:3-884(+)
MAEAVGFIGLGLMGEGMARRLVGSGRSLVVWNRSIEKSEALRAESPEQVRVAQSPAGVFAESSLVYCMLSTPEAVRSVYEMEGGVLEGVAPGKTVIDCATLAEEDMARLSAQVIAKGGRFLEAPVSGSKGPAAAGQLIFLCGGDEALFTECADDLDVMGKAKFFFGGVGQGTRMKLVVNMVMGSMMAAFGEGLSLCDASGLDGAKLLQVLDLGAIANPMFKLKGPKMLASDHAPNFPLKHAEKDMRLAVELGKSQGLELPVASTADSVMQKAMAAGHQDKDFSSVIEAQRKSK